ncbi:MAG: aspartate aminotransferase family protein [Deltaproteobacteria bacterium]|nr:aspartate aminotransferase family protein [Deltaproteobacteria bacterium]
MSAPPSPEKKELTRRYAHHFTPMRVRTMQHVGLDLFEEERWGCYAKDLDGRVFLDALAVGGVFNLGRRHPEIVAALREALETLDIGNNFLMSRERLKLAEKLAATTPGDVNCAVFGVSGSEAVDLAIKIARGYTSRPRVISAEECYHGCTGFAISAIGNPDYRAPFEPLVPGFSRVPYGDIDALAATMDGEVAAVILEPLIAEAGLLQAPAGYFAKVRELCDRHEALLIVDEVVSGLGRTGTFWGIEQHPGVVPDLMVSAKGLSAGMYPISATLFSETVADFFLTYPFSHYSSFGGPDLGCVVASKMIDIVNQPAFLAAVRAKGERLGAGYQALHDKYPAQVRGYGQVGMATALRFSDPDAGYRMNHYLALEGVFAILATNDPSSIRLYPPLVMEEPEIDQLLAALDRALARLAHTSA